MADAPLTTYSLPADGSSSSVPITSNSTTAANPGLVSPVTVNNSIADVGQKFSEIGAGRLNMQTDPSAPGGASSQSFGALVNGSFGPSLQAGVAQMAQGAVGLLPGPLQGIGASLISRLTGGISGGKGASGTEKFWVKLVSRVTHEVFVCEAMPSIHESGEVQYEEVQLVQHPGSILKYTNTPSRTWSIGNIKLVSQTAAEATKNQNYISLLRTWRMPYYGYGTGDGPMKKNLGAPPDVLDFTAYGSTIGKIPVVLTSFDWEWPQDVDWIHTNTGEPFPVLMTISLSIKEAWSPEEFSGFDISMYRVGDMTKAYNKQNFLKHQNDDNRRVMGDAPKDNKINPAVIPPPDINVVPIAAISKKGPSSGEAQSCTKQEAVAVQSASDKALSFPPPTQAVMAAPQAGTPMDAINNMANSSAFNPMEYALKGGGAGSSPNTSFKGF